MFNINKSQGKINLQSLKPINQIARLTGRQAKSYGWAKSHFLAVYKYKDTLEERDATIPNPDNFAMFALAVYLDNFWWGTGYARSQPVSLQPQRRNDGNATGFVVSRLKS